MRIPVVALVLVAAALTSCSGGCGASPLDAVEDATGIRATSCAPAVEFEGTTYIQWGCPPVRDALLGPVEARNDGYLARSIVGVPPSRALAVRELHESIESSCRGWLFWGDADLDQVALTTLAREVNATGRLE